MMSEVDDRYTPTTQEVSDHWTNVGFAGDRSSFNRWLAEVVAEVKAAQRGEDAKIAVDAILQSGMAGFNAVPTARLIAEAILTAGDKAID